jgi:hypothetical protein
MAPSDEEATDVAAAQEQYARDTAEVGRMAEAAGLQKVSDTLYVLELGIGVCPMDEAEARWVGPDDIDPETLVGGASMLAWARIFQRALDSAEVKNRSELARMTNISRARVTEIMNMLKLDRTVQDEILAGTYGQVSEHGLREVIKLEGPFCSAMAAHPLLADALERLALSYATAYCPEIRRKKSRAIR